LGNVVSPEDIIKKSGAEILRLWVSAEDYRDDIRLSQEIIERLTEAYRKIRNTARYLLGNLDDYEDDPEGRTASVSRSGKDSLLEIDRWALSRLQCLVRDVTGAYDSFDFHEVYHRLYNFCIVDMSSFYLDILKDRLYTFRKDSAPRRAAQFVLREILLTMTKLMAPVLSFTAEEIWGHIKDRDAESVFLSSFPEFEAGFHDPALEERWKALIAVRDEVNKALEIKRKERVIGNALEARVTLYAPPVVLKTLEPYAEFLPTLLIVSQAVVSPLPGGQKAADGGMFESALVAGLKVKVEKAEGRKCERCWNYRTSVGTVPGAPEICSRCYEAIK
jgi:isoleucyl-tRNA synthetase